MKILSVVFIFLPLLLMAQELEIYTKERYNLDYKTQSEQTKEKIQKEYQQISKLSQIIEKNHINKNKTLAVLKDMAVVNLWSNDFIKNYQPSNDALEKIYKKTHPQLEARYKLSTIKVQYKANAQKIIDDLKKIKDKEKKISTFENFVHQYSIDIKSKKEKGSLGWIPVQKLKPVVKKAVENAKIGDIEKVFVEDDGWHILLLEDFSPAREASFEEAKSALIQLAKQQALQAQMQKLLQ